MTMFQGSCLCGSVRYQFKEIAGPYVYCHCSSCRKASGSAFAANVAVPSSDFNLIEGEALLSCFESSPGKRRYFCSKCGSPLFNKVGTAPALVRVRLGSLDSPFTEPPAAHIFTSEKAPWYEIQEGARQFPAWPKPEALAVPGSRQGTTDVPPGAET
ncbi:MAG: GFA family protein [Pseudomonadota bacterium]